MVADELIGHVTVVSADDRHTGLQVARRRAFNKGKMSVLRCIVVIFDGEI